jgi:hypothetical protein
MPKLSATDRNGAPVDIAMLKGQWLLVAVADAAATRCASNSSTCSASCAKAWAAKKTAWTASGW